MDLQSLRYFQTVARHQHLTRAATELMVAQPSLSRVIGRLEADLGVTLFDRAGRGLRLNRNGVLFARRVDAALGQLDDARRELADADGLTGGRVTVAAETLFTVSELARDFLTAHPKVELRLLQASAGRMTALLRDAEADLCLASQPLADPRFVTDSLLHEPVLLAVPRTHRLAGRRQVTLREIADEPFVVTRQGYWQRELTDRLFADAGLEVVVGCESDEPGATQELIATGIGIGLVPSMARRQTDHPPVHWLRLQAPNCHRILTAVRRGDRYLSAAARTFLDQAATHFGRVAEE